jgi:hypothetical protein
MPWLCCCIIRADGITVGADATRCGCGSYGALEVGQGASAVFRRICKGWRDAHDQSVIRLSVMLTAAYSLPSSFMMRMKFPRLKEIRASSEKSVRYFLER